MQVILEEVFSKISNWANTNQGVLALALFVVTALFGWVSGIFRALRQRPHVKFSALPGPTFCCTYELGRELGGLPAHKTAFALYLDVANTGLAATSISKIRVGYHWSIRPISIDWFRYRLGWFWLKDQTVALDDFHVDLGEQKRVYPFLVQRTNATNSPGQTYLQPGESANGVVYFEQVAAWGGAYPLSKNGKVSIRVQIENIHGQKFVERFQIPTVSLEAARSFNPLFGESHDRFDAVEMVPRENAIKNRV